MRISLLPVVLLFFTYGVQAQKYNFSGIYVHTGKGKYHKSDTIKESYTIWADSFKHDFSIAGKAYIRQGQWKIYRQRKEEDTDKATGKVSRFERLYISMNDGERYGYFEYPFLPMNDPASGKKSQLSFISCGKRFTK